MHVQRPLLLRKSPTGCSKLVLLHAAHRFHQVALVLLLALKAGGKVVQGLLLIAE